MIEYLHHSATEGPVWDCQCSDLMSMWAVVAEPHSPLLT